MKNKKLSIIFLVISFLFILTSSCFASNNETIEVDFNGDKIVFPTYLSNLDVNFTDYEYTLSYCKDGTYRLNFCMESNVDKVFYYINQNSSSFHNVQFKDNDGNNLPEYRYKLVDGSWVLTDGGTDGLVRTELSSFILATTDVYDSKGELFFHRPPLSRLARIVEEAQAQETIMEIVKILPLTLVVVVSYLGLRKALRLLSTLLHQA